MSVTVRVLFWVAVLAISSAACQRRVEPPRQPERTCTPDPATQRRAGEAARRGQHLEAVEGLSSELLRCDSTPARRALASVIQDWMRTSGTRPRRGLVPLLRKALSLLDPALPLGQPAPRTSSPGVQLSEAGIRVSGVLAASLLQIDSDGRRLLIGSIDQLSLFDVDASTCLWSKRYSLGDSRGVAALSPDGARIFVDASSSIEIVDWRSGRTASLKRPAASDHPIRALVSSPSGRSLVVLDGVRLQLWPVAGGPPRLDVPLILQDWESPPALAVAPVDRLVAYSRPGEVTLVSAGTPRRFPLPPGERCSALRFDPAGKRLACAAGPRYLEGGPRTSFLVWDVATGRVLQQHASSPSLPRALAFDPLGVPVATTVHAYEATSEVHDLDLRRARARHPDPSPTALEPTAHAWVRINRARVVRHALSRDGRRLAVAGLDDGLAVHDLVSHRRLPLKLDSPAWMKDVAFHPTLPLLAVADYRGAVMLWDLEKGHPPRRLVPPGGDARALSWGPQGRHLIVDRRRIYEWRTGREVGPLPSRDRDALVVLDPQEQNALVARGDRLFVLPLWPRAPLPEELGEESFDFWERWVVSPDGQFLATCGAQPRLFTIASRSRVQTRVALPASSWCEFDAQGQLLLASRPPGQLSAHRADTGEPVWRMPLPGWVLDLQRARSHLLVLEAGHAVLWDLKTRRRQWQGAGKPLTWKTAFSVDPGHRYLATADEGPLFKLTDLRTGVALAEATAASTEAWAVGTPDGDLDGTAAAGIFILPHRQGRPLSWRTTLLEHRQPGLLAQVARGADAQLPTLLRLMTRLARH